jgi:hypothetical protein
MIENQGQKAEPLRAALRDALGGRGAALDELFKRHGDGPGTRPNLKLAAAFGDEIAALEDTGNAVARLLARLSADDAAPDTPEVFFPMAAAHGWIGRIRAGRDVEAAWAALCELAGDERPPVRAATLAALRAHALVRQRSSELVARAGEWLDAEDREVRYGAAAVIIDVLADRQALGASRLDDVMAYLSRALAEAGDAPRSAERSDGRRRLLAALPRALAAVVATGTEANVAWLEEECRKTAQPTVRAALSDALLLIQRGSALVGQRVRDALHGSAKPPRDPSRIRPGAGRGKASRPAK